jgi:hypothetical protein
VREWGLRNSSLEEVFLRLAAQSTEVNAAVAGAGQDVEPPRMCALCGELPPEQVVLFTSKGVKVESSDLICSRCSQLSQAELSELRKKQLEPELVDVETAPLLTPIAPPAGLPQVAPSPIGAPVTPPSGTSVAVNGASPTVETPLGASLWQQAWAVFVLRLQVQWKQVRFNICYAVIILIFTIISIATSPSNQISGTLCPGGFAL